MHLQDQLSHRRCSAGRVLGGWLVRLLLLLFVLAFVLYSAALVALWFMQERLLFAPQTLPAQHRFELGADVHEGFIDVPGARLNTLHLRLPKPAGVVVYLHGNGGNLQSWFVNAEFYRQANMDLFMLDYRGYGKSSGRIESEAQLHADARAAWDAVAPQYAGRRKVLIGRSLGTGLAAKLAADVQPDATLLVSPYVSMVSLALEHYPWVPQAVLRYPLRSDEAVARIRGPLMLLHGERDTLIAPSHSQRLKLHNPNSELLLVVGAGHNDIQSFEAYLDAVRRRISDAPASAKPTNTTLPGSGNARGENAVNTRT